MLRYSCTALLGLNKQGIIKPNSDGYYELVLSALDYPNPVGATYRTESARRILDGSPFFRRKIAEGNLLGEVDHPNPRDCKSDADYERRLYEIDMQNVCLHISDVWIDDSGALKDRDGKSYTGIMGLVMPSGVKGEAFRASLDNPKQNTCLSVRSITDNYRTPSGQIEKEFVAINAWDWVVEPGLRPANKFSAPSLEGYPVDPNNLRRIMHDAEQSRYGLEAASMGAMQEVLSYRSAGQRPVLQGVQKNAKWLGW